MLVERIRLIAATAEPDDSFSACVVSSSRASASAQNSQVRASRERPVGRRGTNGADVDGEARAEMETNGRALWLRWRPAERRRGFDNDEAGRGGRARGGDEERSAETSSALPSRDKDKRTLEDGVDVVEELKRFGHEEGSCGSKLLQY
jgi:hypothetical protein